MPAQRKPHGVQIEARLQATGAKSVKVRYTLSHHEKALHVDMVVDKEVKSFASRKRCMSPSRWHWANRNSTWT